MISELVAGSAWMKPPVDGCAAAVRPVVAGLPAVDELPVVETGVLGDDTDCAAPPPPAAGAAPLELVPTAPKAARTTVARRVASAFFRCTTHMPPPGPI